MILHRNSKGVKQAVKEAFKSGREKSDAICWKTFIKEIVKFRNLYQGSLIVSLFNGCLNIIHLTARLSAKKKYKENRLNVNKFSINWLWGGRKAAC